MRVSQILVVREGVEEETKDPSQKLHQPGSFQRLLVVTGFKLVRYIFATHHSAVTAKVDFGINWRQISFLAWP